MNCTALYKVVSQAFYEHINLILKCLDFKVCITWWCGLHYSLHYSNIDSFFIGSVTSAVPLLTRARLQFLIILDARCCQYLKFSRCSHLYFGGYLLGSCPGGPSFDCVGDYLLFITYGYLFRLLGWSDRSPWTFHISRWTLPGPGVGLAKSSGSCLVTIYT